MLGGAGLLGLGAFEALTAGLVSAFGGGKRGAAAVTALYGAGARGLPFAGREQLRKTAARAADSLGRDVQAAAEGVRQANRGAIARVQRPRRRRGKPQLSAPSGSPRYRPPTACVREPDVLASAGGERAPQR